MNIWTFIFRYRADARRLDAAGLCQVSEYGRRKEFRFEDQGKEHRHEFRIIRLPSRRVISRYFNRRNRRLHREGAHTVRNRQAQKLNADVSKSFLY